MTNWWYFSYFSLKTGFDISCKLSPMETIYMKCQNLFSGKNKKNITICHLLKILPTELSVNEVVLTSSTVGSLPVSITLALAGLVLSATSTTRCGIPIISSSLSAEPSIVSTSSPPSPDCAAAFAASAASRARRSAFSFSICFWRSFSALSLSCLSENTEHWFCKCYSST